MRISDWSSDVCSSDLKVQGSTKISPCNLKPISSAVVALPAAESERFEGDAGQLPGVVLGSRVFDPARRHQFDSGPGLPGSEAVFDVVLGDDEPGIRHAVLRYQFASTEPSQQWEDRKRPGSGKSG